MWCWLGWGLLFSGGREWEGTGPYGDPCCTEQVNTLSLFCSLLVVLATELAHSQGEREGVRENWISLTCCCYCNSNTTGSWFRIVNRSVCAIALMVFPETLGKKKIQVEARGLCLKEACGQYPDIRGKQEKMYLLFTGNENKHACVEWRALARLLEQQVFKLQMVYTYCIQCGSTSSNRACKHSNGGKDPEILDLSPNITKNFERDRRPPKWQTAVV